MEIHGLDSLKEALSRSPDHLRALVSAAVSTSVYAATNRAQSLAPRDTGRLQQAISGTSRDTSGRVLIDDAAYYWRMVEFGTIHQNARPFIRTTAELERPDFERRMELVARKFGDDLSVNRFI